MNPKLHTIPVVRLDTRSNAERMAERIADQRLVEIEQTLASKLSGCDKLELIRSIIERM